ncbi:MAG: hypothetical protein HZC42_05730 [Candidatus Eisenbacteria bacterium]|nr:hypothetical protein [Candidatus Eisenbacteria bacterium]
MHLPKRSRRPRGAAAAVLLCLAAGLGARAAFPAPAATRLLAAGPGSIRFEVNVPEPRFEPLTGVPAAAGERMSRLVLEGYDAEAAAGEPALPVRVVLVAVPPLGEVRLAAAATDPATTDGVLLASQPGADRGDREGRPVYARSAVAYAARGPRPAQRAELLDVSWMRNQRVARVALRPADYDAAARRVSVWRRVEVELQVQPAGEPGAPAEGADPFERVYRRALVNYEQGKAWRRPAARELLGRAGAAGRAALQAAVPESSVFAGRLWVKIAIQQTGFYKVDFGQLRNLGLFDQDTTVALDSLRLFTWPGVPVLPEENYCDSCDYREVAIGFSDNGDGRFNRNSDYLYFFAMGPSGWASDFDPARPETVFVDNPYETRNYYYLTRGGTLPELPPVGGEAKRIRVVPAPVVDDGTEVRPLTFRARLHAEQDNEYWPDASSRFASRYRAMFWEKWYWRSITQGGQFTVSVPAPGADTALSDPAAAPPRARILTWGLNYNAPPYPYYKTPGIVDHYLDASFADVTFPQRAFDELRPALFDTTLGALNTYGNPFAMRIPSVNDPNNPYRVDRTGLAWIDLYYPRFFEPAGDSLLFDSPAGGNGNVIYTVGPFSGATPPRVFDVTDATTPFELGSLSYDGTAKLLRFEVTEDARRRYRVIQDAGVVKVGSRAGSGEITEASGASLTNLRNQPAVDYLVVYWDGFKVAADSLAAWRAARLPSMGAATPFQTRAVPVSALYDQFSGGRTDPGAIRNFLRAVFFNWNDATRSRPNCAFVTFLGDASYDFKNLTGRAPAGQPGTLVPSYEGGFDSAVRRQFASDDWMLDATDAANIIPDFFGGRIPVDDPGTALDVVRKKVLAYERSVPLGEYRDRVMFIADDNEQGDNVDPLGWTHLSQTAALDSLFTPRHIDRAYVYLHTYPDGPGATKPGARADVKKNINDGVAMFNFIGHGSPFKIADESVLLDTDVGTLTNAPRFNIFVAASCDVGKFNDPTVQSLGERLIISTVGGSVGVVSATELAFSNQNAELNQILYREIFRRDTTDCQYHVSLSEALLVAKSGSTNNQKYQLLGDSGTGVNLPRLWAEITLADSAGVNPITEVKRGATVSFRGRVLTCPGGAPVPLTGTASLLIEDSSPIDQTPDCSQYSCYKYYYKAGPIYRGDVGVANGEFHGRFVVPIEAKDGALGRVRAYLEGRAAGQGFDTDGVGSIAAQVSPGAGVTGDTEGPRIALAFAGGSTFVRPNAALNVNLYDPSGILITAHSPQNGIVVTLDGNTTNRVDITASFRYAADSYQSGTASWELPSLPKGAHNVTVSAADNLAAGLNAPAHRSKASLDFTVVDNPPLRIARAYLFPNPTGSGGWRGGGQFVVDAPGDSVNVLLRLYTVSGRLIRTLRAFGGLGQVQIPWDGLDDEGAALANGVYFFQVHVNGRDEEGASSPRQQADAAGRFVILNR